MTQDEIIEMARSIDPQSWAQQHPDDDEWCIKFAKLVEDAAFKRWAAQTRLVRYGEREACAKVCDELHWEWHMGDNSGPKECAETIRARGEA